jgi:hypothetical protein
VLAENGCRFLLARVPNDETALRIAAHVKRMGAPTAQRYGHFTIEELTEASGGTVRARRFGRQPTRPTTR